MTQRKRVDLAGQFANYKALNLGSDRASREKSMQKKLKRKGSKKILHSISKSLAVDYKHDDTVMIPSATQPVFISLRSSIEEILIVAEQVEDSPSSASSPLLIYTQHRSISP